MFVKSLVLVIAGATLCVGCHESAVSAPRVPVPVLLGPIDRVGGHRGEGKMVAPFTANNEEFLSIVVGSRTATVAGAHGGTTKLAVAVLNATDARHDADVRIQRIGTGAWLWFTPQLGTVMVEQWTDVDAKVTAEQPR